jgi:hypothetical protein
MVKPTIEFTEAGDQVSKKRPPKLQNKHSAHTTSKAKPYGCPVLIRARSTSSGLFTP